MLLLMLKTSPAPAYAPTHARATAFSHVQAHTAVTMTRLSGGVFRNHGCHVIPRNLCDVMSCHVLSCHHADVGRFSSSACCPSLPSLPFLPFFLSSFLPAGTSACLRACLSACLPACLPSPPAAWVPTAPSPSAPTSTSSPSPAGRHGSHCRRSLT